MVVLHSACHKKRDQPLDPEIVLKDTALILAYDHFYEDFDWAFTDTPSIPMVSAARLLCGYAPNKRWGRLSWNWTACPLNPLLATTAKGELLLQVPGNSLKQGSQVETLRHDYGYGVYRARIKAGAHSGIRSGSQATGSVNAFFFYSDSTGHEIDIEILTVEHVAKKVYFTTHPGNYSIGYVLPNDPTSQYFEYGFNWYANKVDFFVDEVIVATQTHGIPSDKGKLIFNHWTGNPFWGGSPPTDVATMQVDAVWHTPFLLVTYPDASHCSFSKETILEIAWNAYGEIQSHPVNIELWNNGKFFEPIAQNVANTGSFQWHIPPSLPISSNYQIKVCSNLSEVYFDCSDVGFSIR